MPSPPQRNAYAGLVSRVVALLIDVALLTLTALAISTLPELAWQEVLVRAVPGWFSAGVTAAAALVPWAYFAACWWLNGQTIGDLLIGVVVLRSDGQELSFPHAAARSLAGLLLAPLWLLGLFAVLWDERRRAWHDRIFRTVVRYTVKARATRSQPA